MRVCFHLSVRAYLVDRGEHGAVLPRYLVHEGHRLVRNHRVQPWFRLVVNVVVVVVVVVSFVLVVVVYMVCARRINHTPTRGRFIEEDEGGRVDDLNPDAHALQL